MSSKNLSTFTMLATAKASVAALALCLCGTVQADYESFKTHCLHTGKVFGEEVGVFRNEYLLPYAPDRSFYCLVKGENVEEAKRDKCKNLLPPHIKDVLSIGACVAAFEELL